MFTGGHCSCFNVSLSGLTGPGARVTSVFISLMDPSSNFLAAATHRPLSRAGATLTHCTLHQLPLPPSSRHTGGSEVSGHQRSRQGHVLSDVGRSELSWERGSMNQWINIYVLILRDSVWQPMIVSPVSHVSHIWNRRGLRDRRSFLWALFMGLTNKSGFDPAMS